MLHDWILPVIEVVNEHIVFPVQREGEVNLPGGFLDIGDDGSPFSKVPFIPRDNEIIACVKQDITGSGAKAEGGIVTVKKRPLW